MKRKLKELGRDEAGQTFILVLILLLLGGLMIAPLLGFMGTGLKAGQAYEKRMAELYAADAGVEDALWQIMTKPAGLPQAEDDPPMPPYSIADVNGKQVNLITITYIDETTYRIEATATSVDVGSSTTIESYVNILSFTDFMNNSITSKGPVTLKPGSQVWGDPNPDYGDVVYGEEPAPSQDQVDDGDVRPITEEELNAWPNADDLHLYYWPDVEGSEPFPYPDGTVIDVKDTDNIGPLYCEGDLDIKCTNEGEVAQLHYVEGNGTEEELGTVYVKGDLNIAGPKDYKLDLNYQTIFVEGEIDIGSNCTITGSGCIVALGDIFFSPKLESTPDDFVFVMSVDGWLQLNPGAPSSDFYGSLAGNVDVQLQPGKQLHWSGPPPELRYPGAEPSPKNVIKTIRTWEIDPH